MKKRERIGFAKMMYSTRACRFTPTVVVTMRRSEGLSMNYWDCEKRISMRLRKSRYRDRRRRAGLENGGRPESGRSKIYVL